MIKHIFKWFIKSTYFFIVDIPVMILGLILVPIGIKFRWVDTSQPERPFTDPRFEKNGGNWRLVRMPSWLLWWDNCYDGLLGDKRGWWNNYCLEKWKKTSDSFIGMYSWTAIRNPSNYWGRVICGCDVSKCEITKLAGQDVVDEDHPGWHFIVATEKDTNRQFHYLGFCFPWWFDKTHAVFGRFGWKINLSHNNVLPDAREQDRIKGHVYRVSPWKAID